MSILGLIDHLAIFVKICEHRLETSVGKPCEHSVNNTNKEVQGMVAHS